MLVRNWMNRDLAVIEANENLPAAMRLMKEKKIKTLPVLEKGRLVGVVTDRDIKEASASNASTLEVHELRFLLDKIKVREIMSKDPVTVSPEDTVEETAKLLLDKDISGAPVVDSAGNVVGTITQKEMFKVIISLTGVGTQGMQFALRVEDRPGLIRDVVDIIRKYGGRMVSILSSTDSSGKGMREVYIRMHSIDRGQMDEMKQEIGGKAEVIYLVDHREGKREILDP